MNTKSILYSIVSIILISSIILLSQIDTTLACTPIYSTPQERFTKSDAVFMGRVISASMIRTTENSYDVFGEVEVQKYWKGNVQNNVKIKSSGVYNCGAAFGENSKGSDYLIYASKMDEKSEVYIIGMTHMRLASTSMSEIRLLGDGLLPNSQIENSRFMRNLTIGYTGADVIKLQTFLERKGFLVLPFGVTKGYFGNLTKSALSKYQNSVGITPAIGFLGPITRAKINLDF